MKYKFFTSTALVGVGIMLLVLALASIDSFLALGKITLSPNSIVTGDIDIATRAFGSTSRVAVSLLAMLVSGLAITLPLAANNLTPRLISMFIEDRINRAMFGLLLCFSTVSMWACWTARREKFPDFSTYLCFLLFLLSISAMVPYLFYLFSFLNVNSILLRLQKRTEQKIHSVTRRRLSQKRLLTIKSGFIANFDSIANIALRAIERRDRQAFVSATEILQVLAIRYAQSKKRLPPEWHTLDHAEIGMFVGMLAPARSAIQKQKITFESHLAQLLLEMFESARAKSRDAVDGVSFTVCRISLPYLQNRDLSAVQMYCRLFNSALRLGINNNDARMIYNLLTHYRNLAIEALPHLPEVTLRIARSIIDYAHIARRRAVTQNFIIEFSAYALNNIIQAMLERDDENTLQIVDFMCLLPYEDLQGNKLLGALRAKVIAISTLRLAGREKISQKLLSSIAPLDKDVIQILQRTLIEENPLLYREITPQQMNLYYVTENIRPQIAEILGELTKAHRVI